MIHMNLIENLAIHYARKLCMCVLTLVAHSRAFFTIEAPALNDFSFYHYYYHHHHHHERTTTTTTTMCALRSDSSRQQNHEEVVQQCIYMCLLALLLLSSCVNSGSNNDLRGCAAVASTTTNLRPIFQFGRLLMSRFYHRGKHKTLFTFSKGPKRLGYKHSGLITNKIYIYTVKKCNS